MHDVVQASYCFSTSPIQLHIWDMIALSTLSLQAHAEPHKRAGRLEVLCDSGIATARVRLDALLI
jgi:hypothetical protein